MIKFLLTATLVLSSAFSPFSRAQTNSQANTQNRLDDPLAYDVVSIKLNSSGLGRWGINVGDYTYQATNIPLKELLASAYGIKSDLISGIPARIDATRFDIDAKIVPNPAAPRKLTDTQRPGMLKAMLADRFGIKASIEVKTLPVFELVVARSGLKISQSPPGNGADSGINIHPAALTAHEVTMTQLAGALTGILHRSVIDKTGLAGNYDVDLKWTSDNASHSPETNPDTGDSAPTIFTALEEQLGLKLQSSKGPVDTLVVDHVEMPSEN
jgi:uncharacterized protein (TIGR03435 family)